MQHIGHGRLAWHRNSVRGVHDGAAQVVSGAGAVDHAQLVELSEKAFAKLPTSSVTTKQLIETVRRPAPAQPLPIAWRTLGPQLGRSAFTTP